MKKRNILIIGAGELGSRHLQGIIKSQYDLDVYCVDPSENSLAKAKSRSEEILHTHNLKFLKNYNDIPQEIFLCIVATSANIREYVVKDLLKTLQIENLVLEKVLYQSIKSFENIDQEIEKLLIKPKIWVNHPRRMFPIYQKIKTLAKNFGKLIEFNLIGSNWGLACNSLHYLDLIEFLAESEINIIDSESINNSIIDSKRSGFIEFSGKIKGELKNGVRYEINDVPNIPSTSISLILSFEKCVIFIQETPIQICKIIHNNKINEDLEFITGYQSSLSTEIIDNLISGKELMLTRYNSAINTHKLFIESLLNKYNTIKGIESEVLPIT